MHIYIYIIFGYCIEKGHAYARIHFQYWLVTNTNSSLFVSIQFGGWIQWEISMMFRRDFFRR